MKTPGEHYWHRRAVEFGSQACDDAGKNLMDEDTYEVAGSILELIGSEFAYAIKRQILLRELEATHWNLAHTADRLRLKGPPKVLHAIRTLGLEDEYAKAKADGRAMGKGRKKRVPL